MQSGRFEIYTYYSAVGRRCYFTACGWLDLDRDHYISTFDRKTILLFPDNLISSDLKF